ncbi:MAG: hypothetical protein AB1330_01410 [Bacillota bacterium]
MRVSCEQCLHYLPYDPALDKEDPWIGAARRSRPYRSLRGCRVQPEPGVDYQVKAYDDLSVTSRCVCDAVARMINNDRSFIIRRGMLFDRATNRYVGTIQRLEREAMRDRALGCANFAPRFF